MYVCLSPKRSYDIQQIGMKSVEVAAGTTRNVLRSIAPVDITRAYSFSDSYSGAGKMMSSF